MQRERERERERIWEACLFSSERNFKNQIKQASLGWAIFQDSLSHCPCTWTLVLPSFAGLPRSKVQPGSILSQ